MTERIFRYLREQQPETPCLVVDLDVVENNFRRMRELLPAAHIFYAVKANPAAQILARLATAVEVKAYRALMAEAQRVAEQIAQAAKLQLTVLSTEDLNRLKGQARSQKD